MDFRSYIELLHPLSDQAWIDFRNLFKPKKLKKGEYFMTEGAYAKELGFMTEGTIRAFYRSAEGIEYNKHFFVDPCFVGGYASLVSKTINKINHQALCDCNLLVAPYFEIEKLYTQHRDLESVARVLAERFFIQKEQREIEIVLLDADKRYEIFKRDFPNLDQKIPQYHIASYLGITPTQLSRIRRKI